MGLVLRLDPSYVVGGNNSAYAKAGKLAMCSRVKDGKAK